MNFDLISQASAIDDSFFAVDASAGVQPDDTDGRSWISGPRSGHWTVSNTANGSGIDDRSPTLVGYPIHSDYGSITPAKRIDANVLRKLASATEAQRQAREQAAKGLAAERDAVREAEQQDKTNSHKAKQGFYVPKLDDNRGIRIRTRDGKNEVVQQPKPKLVALSKPTIEKPEVKPAVKHNGQSRSRLASIKSVAAVSDNSKPTRNRVRIVGKNGEESFVELPFLPHIAKSTHAVQTQKGTPQAVVDTLAPVTAPADDPKTKAKRDAMAEKEAHRLRNERLAAEAMAMKAAEKQRIERLAAEAMMHGALPASSKASSGPGLAKQSKSSSKASERRTPGVFDFASKPASIASSKTSVTKTPPNQSQEGEKKASQERSKPSTIAGWQEVGQGSYEPAASHKHNSERHNATAQPNTRATPKNSPEPPFASQHDSRNSDQRSHRSFASRSANQQYSYHNPSNYQKAYSNGDQHFNQVGHDAGDKSARASANSAGRFTDELPPPSNQYPRSEQQDNRGFTPIGQGPTVFAGRGWISPHPLSEAPTWAREGPQPAIRLPPGAAIRAGSTAATMTYEEWLAVQNQTDTNISSRAATSNVQTVASSAKTRSAWSDRNGQGAGRRNFSITESHATRQYAGGSWAFREDARDRPSSYRPPTAKTESAVGGSQQHSLQRSNRGDTAEVGEDGKVQLKMPWDEPPSMQKNVSPSPSDDLFF